MAKIVTTQRRFREFVEHVESYGFMVHLFDKSLFGGPEADDDIMTICARSVVHKTGLRQPMQLCYAYMYWSMLSVELAKTAFPDLYELTYNIKL